MASTVHGHRGDHSQTYELRQGFHCIAPFFHLLARFPYRGGTQYLEQSDSLFPVLQKHLFDVYHDADAMVLGHLNVLPTYTSPIDDWLQLLLRSQLLDLLGQSVDFPVFSVPFSYDPAPARVSVAGPRRHDPNALRRWSPRSWSNVARRGHPWPLSRLHRLHARHHFVLGRGTAHRRARHLETAPKWQLDRQDRRTLR